MLSKTALNEMWQESAWVLSFAFGLLATSIALSINGLTKLTAPLPVPVVSAVNLAYGPGQNSNDISAECGPSAPPVDDHSAELMKLHHAVYIIHPANLNPSKFCY